jgi:hypothetical protein
MPIEKTFRELSGGLRMLGERVQELRITLMEDRPRGRNDAAVLDDFEYAVEDAGGWLNEALGAANEAHRAAGDQVDMNRARQALTVCQEKFRRAEAVFSASFFSYDRMQELTTFGSERRGEWPSWTSAVKLGIDHCRKPADDVRTTFDTLWQDLAERSGTSISNTNIVQQITPSRPVGAGKR